MIIINNFKDLNSQLSTSRRLRKSIGFIPTMGALHSGHASLIKESKRRNNVTVCSIFVNPLQFNNREDYIHYPVTVDKDISLLEELDCDILFLPSEEEVYPDEASKSKQYNLGYLENILEGKFRPGHFQGVCLVVERLLIMVKPDFLFLGQKDYQQCLVIEKLVQIMGADIEIIKCPILREESGLAKSSRNLRLSENALIIGAELYRSLLFIRNNATANSFANLKKETIKHLESKGIKIEYLALASAADLQLEQDFKQGEKQVILVAAYLDGIRLIDNLVLE